MKLVSKTLVAAIAAIGLHGAAQATINLGVNPANYSRDFDRNGPNPFQLDIFTFKLDSPGAASFNLNVSGKVDSAKSWLNNTAYFGLVKLLDNAQPKPRLDLDFIGGKHSLANGYSYTNLEAGTYALNVGGTVLGGKVFKWDNAGGYSLNVHSMAVTPPVPEASEWAMLMAGLGVVGAIARRRQKKVA